MYLFFYSFHTPAFSFAFLFLSFSDLSLFSGYLIRHSLCILLLISFFNTPRARSPPPPSVGAIHNMEKIWEEIYGKSGRNKKRMRKNKSCNKYCYNSYFFYHFLMIVFCNCSARFRCETFPNSRSRYVKMPLISYPI